VTDPCRQICGRAIELGAKRAEDLPCETCTWVVDLDPANERILELIQRFSPGLFRVSGAGTVSVQYEGLAMAFDHLSIPEEARPEVARKVHAVAGLLAEHLRREAGRAG